MSILQDFIHEYNELYYKTLNKEVAGDIFNEIKQVEKNMTNPKFHPTQELKLFYKSLREHYSMPFKILLLGNNALAKVIFMNILLKDAVIPLQNTIIQKKFVIRYSTLSFVRAHYKNSMVTINIHTFDTTQSNLDEVEYFEILTNIESFRNLEIIKDCDELNKKTLHNVKDMDLILWIREIKGKIQHEEILTKIIKKKPVVTILTYINKNFEYQELLEQISAQTKSLAETFGLNAIYDIDLWQLFYEYKLDEKFMLYKTFSLLNKQIFSLKSKFIENAILAIDSSKTAIESFEQKPNTKPAQNDKMQNDKMQNIIESMLKILQNAKINRASFLLKEALEKNKIIDSHYKTLFAHYKKLDNVYHKANLTITTKAIQLNNKYNYEILGAISKSLKKYFDSIVDSIWDNIELVKIRTRPLQANFFDMLTNRQIVYESFRINTEEIFKEMEDTQSLLARKHKSLLTKINRSATYITQNVEDSLESFGFVIEEWIKQGHHLVLQKKPPFISMDRYFSLEEFNLSVYSSFTKKHNEIMRDFANKIQAKLTALSMWVQATKHLALECIIRRLEQKFQNDKILAKTLKIQEIKPLTREFLEDCVLEVLPPEIHKLFCELPSSRIQYENIPLLLYTETRENEKIIRYRIHEMIDLRQTIKVSTKLLENTIALNQTKP